MNRVSFLSKKKIIVGALLSVVALSSYGIYKSFQFTDVERAERELASIISAVSKLMVLPEGDEPVLAKVTDAEALVKQQAFFMGALNGDQLLLFPRNLKAIIYSPSRNRIVNAGPIEQSPRLETTDSHSEGSFASNGTGANPVSNGASQNSDIQSSAEDVRESVAVSNALTVEVRNGSGEPGLARSVATKLSTLFGYETIVNDAASKSYKRTIVVVTTNTEEARSAAREIAKEVNGEIVETAPTSEKEISADVLVVLGGE